MSAPRQHFSVGVADDDPALLRLLGRALEHLGPPGGTP